MKRVILAILIMTFSSALQASGEPMAFLKLGAGARATGMGTAFTALSDDASGVFYNPAGIVRVTSLQLVAETYLLSFTRNMNFISTCKPFIVAGKVYSVGLSWVNFSAGGDIEKRYTNSADPLEKISDNTHIFTLTTATYISNTLYVGAAIKANLQLIDKSKAAGVGFDIGAILNITDGLYVGVSGMNLGSSLAWDDEASTESVPPVINAGVAWKLADLLGVAKLDVTMAFDYMYNTSGFYRLKPGVELGANGFFFLRAGYNEGLTIGCGLRLKPGDVFAVKLDYAFVADRMLENSSNHRLGLTMDFTFKEQGQAINTIRPAEEKKKDKKDEEAPW